ncbi:prepilin-type N-terminal cleavage/methylation domain-containing protein [Candidatus Daviesbacteria bacterium]|nr:prepilin-type N-terminal cleavage/methylation domain-containing protein [Candidatus Daviesbacteria bacterium]
MSNQKGQTLLELVVGMSLIAVVIGAMAITTTYSLRNTQFSKNQAQATMLAQENMEKVRTIKSANYGVCLQGKTPCLTWEEIWDETFGSYSSKSCTLIGCTYIPSNNCTVTGDITKALCLTYSENPIDLGNGFTAQVIIEDEPGLAGTQKRVTSKVFWTDTTGQHSSDLVTVFSKL